MSFDASLEELFEDTVTVEPFAAESGARAQTWGAAVTYKALVQRGARRVIGPQGREVISNVTVIIPNRVQIDPRSRVTLPAGFAPLQPPIIAVEPLKGLGMDHTQVSL